MFSKTALLLLIASGTAINAARLGAFVPRDLSSDRLAVFVPRDLDARNVKVGGGWALSQTSASTCPAAAPQCGASWCCPDSLQCIHTGGEDSAEVCCPTDTDCSSTFLASPTCADSSWSLWNATSDTTDNGGYFCCLQHQIGLQSGSCADALEAVTAGTPAVPLASGTGSVQVEASATGSAAASSTTGSITSATGKSESSSTSPKTASSTASATGAAKSSSSVASSSTTASSSTSTATGKSGAAGSYHIGSISLGGALAAVFAFAML